MSPHTGLELYTRTAHSSSARVIRSYSTSFGLASMLLPRPVRVGIADVYALVRVADEIVDGPAFEAGMGADASCAVLDELERETLAALEHGFSANLVVHAFATTARATGIDAALVRPFFASMRMDAGDVRLDADGYQRYIHGSAEVVGSMCLRVFTLEDPTLLLDAELEDGARRLGAAFQKVNFLRDLGDDSDRLGRRYFPGVEPATITEAQKLAVVDDIAADLAAARIAIRRLPRGARRATSAAAALFDRLNAQLRATPAAELRGRRISVPPAVKLRLFAGAAMGRSGR